MHGMHCSILKKWCILGNALNPGGHNESGNEYSLTSEYYLCKNVLYSYVTVLNAYFLMGTFNLFSCLHL